MGRWDAVSEGNTTASHEMSQVRFWILTIPASDWSFPDELPDGVQYLIGQLERGESGFEHFQLLVHFQRAVRLAAVKRIFGDTCHAEKAVARAAEDYVTKEDTRIEGPFCLGEPKHRRNNKADWDSVWDSAKSGDLESIPANIRVTNYNALRKIQGDFARPEPMERIVFCFYGATGTGKSRRAWDEAGWDAYPKDPNTKFWDGYRGEEHVVIDEFRGRIDISHILRWLDRYPVNVEIKGSVVPLRAKRIWITSNLAPSLWYPTADSATVAAVERRLECVEFPRVLSGAWDRRIDGQEQ